MAKASEEGPCQVSTRYPDGYEAAYRTFRDLPDLIETTDPFNEAVYWPLRNVIPYLGRMGVR